MALTGNDILLPRANAALVNRDGTATIEFRNFLLRFVQDAGAAGAVTEEQLAALTARVQALEDAALEDMLQGFFSVSVNGNQIYLVGDVANPQGSQYYGTDRDGVRGWYNIIDGFEAGTGLVKTISTDGFNFLGYITSTSQLPPTGSLNDAYILNGRYIYWNGTAWADGGSPSNIATLSLAPLADTGVGTFKCITRDAYGRVEGSRNGTADDVPVAKLGAAIYDTLQESINVLNSPGLISGGVLSDGGGGNVAWTAGTVSIRATDSDVATLYMANFAAGTAAIPNDSMTRFLGVSYNAGTPIVIVKTSDTWDYDTEFPIGEVANLGGTLFPFSNPFKVGDPITNIIQRFDAQAYSIRAASGGLLMSTNGTTRNLDLTAGVIWARLNDFSIAARTSTTFPMYSVRPSGVTPPLIFTPGFTQWPNTQYLSGTTLTTMTNNRWANLWVFVNIGTGAWGFAYGTAEYNNSSGASAEQVPAYLTQNFLRQNLLLGRILFEKNSTVPIIESAFTRVFSTQPVSDHNQLSGLQGGTLGQYYHLTSAQLARIPPAGGTTAQFLRGDNAFTNRLDGPIGFFQNADIADGIISVCANSLSNPTPGIEVWADNGSTQANISSTTYGVNGGGIMHGRMARGTKASPTAVLKGDIYCGFGGRPYASGAGFVASSPVSLHWVASENQATSNLGGYFRILTTPKGSNARVERLLINDVGSVWNHDSGTYDPTDESQTKPFSTGWNGFICSATGQNSRNITLAYRNGVGGSAVFNIGAANGTPAAPAFLSVNNEMGYNLFSCWNGSGWSGTASILGYATENHSATALGSGLVLETTANGSTGRSVRLRIDHNGPVTPGADNSQTLGSSALRWSTVYAATGAINTSDASLKTDPRDISEREISAFLEIGRLPMLWQWLAKKDEESPRLHAGPTVQAAIAVMEKHGLDWRMYGAFCYDEWDEQEEVLGDDGTVLVPYCGKGNVYGFRKDELTWLVMRAMLEKIS